MPEKEKYLHELGVVVTNYFYKFPEKGPVNPNEVAYLEGYINAGLISELAASDEIQKVIDEMHFKVFDQTLAERRTTRALEGKDPSAWNIFDKPSYRRK